jgi:hypothetical protein
LRRRRLLARLALAGNGVHDDDMMIHIWHLVYIGGDWYIHIYIFFYFF